MLPTPKRIIIPHETGHWLHLHHTWGPDGFPWTTNNCDQDDSVFDTPNTQGGSSCSNDAYSCGSYDNVNNYMDYACSGMFTEGQISRMHSTLYWTRSKLRADTNIVFTGTDSVKHLQNIAVGLSKGKVKYTTFEAIDFQALVAPFRFEDSVVWTFENSTDYSRNKNRQTIRFLEDGWQQYKLKVYRDGELIGTVHDSVEIVPVAVFQFFNKCLDNPLLSLGYYTSAFTSIRSEMELIRGANDTFKYIGEPRIRDLELPIEKRGLYPVKYTIVFDSLYERIVYDTVRFVGYNHTDDYRVTFDDPYNHYKAEATIRTKTFRASTRYYNDEGYNQTNGLTAKITYGQDTVTLTMPGIDFRKYTTAYVSFDYAFGETSEGDTDQLLVNVVPNCSSDEKHIVFTIPEDSLTTMNGLEVSNASDWKHKIIKIDSPLFSGFSSLQFELQLGGRANFYLDNIRVSGVDVKDSAKAEFSILSDTFNLCVGDSVFIENASTYPSFDPRWTVLGAMSDTIKGSNLVIFPNKTGDYYVQLEVSNHLNYDTLTKHFYVNMLNHDTTEILPKRNSFCHGEAVHLTLGGSYDSLVWEVAGQTSRDDTLFYTNPLSGNHVYYAVTSYLNGCNIQKTKGIGLGEAPKFLNLKTDRDTLFLGYQYDSIKFSVNGALVDSFIWNLGNGVRMVSSGFKYRYQNPGEYTISLEGKNMFCSDTVFDVVFVKNGYKANVYGPESTDWKISPNPSNSFIQIETLKNFSNAQFILYDQLGRMVLRTTLDQKVSIVDISQLNSGMYQYRILRPDNLNRLTGKLIKL